ncbi:hypothetical protein [Nocardia sp. CS682]|uniref:hypothetical protein n=1 Tax=Nocardia sp. CS682 TaxID=1047172 RepID=UPI0010751FEC|nr:hypothetical protein [Nocardia sp. CS682]
MMDLSWVREHASWLTALIPGLDSGSKAPDESGRVVDFHSMTPDSAARAVARIFDVQSMMNAVQQQVSPNYGVQQAKPIVDPQAFTDLDEHGNRIPKPGTVANPEGPPPPTPTIPEVASLPPAITSVDPSLTPTDPPYYQEGPRILPTVPEPRQYSYVDPETGDVKPMNLPVPEKDPRVLQTPGGTTAVDTGDGTSIESQPVNPNSPNANLSRHLIINGPDGKQNTYTAIYDKNGNLTSILDPASGAYVNFRYHKGELVVTDTGTLDPGRAIATTDEVENFFALVLPPLKGVRPVIQGGRGLYNLLKDEPSVLVVPPSAPRNPNTNPPLTIRPPYPDVPEIPSLPDNPDLPVIPGGSEIPGLPDQPEFPEMPGGSEIPNPGGDTGAPSTGAPVIVPIPSPLPDTKPPGEVPGPGEFFPVEPGNTDGQGEFPGPSTPEIQGNENEQAGPSLPRADGTPEDDWAAYEEEQRRHEEEQRRLIEQEQGEAWGARPETETAPTWQSPPRRTPNRWDDIPRTKENGDTNPDWDRVPQSVDRLTQSDLVHILRGDPNRPGQGGHGFDSKIAGKTVFPKSWGDPEGTNDLSFQIPEAVEDIARNPDSEPTWQEDTETWLVEGVRHGVRIHVIVNETGHIITAIPIDGQGVMRNDENGVPQPLR